MITGERVKAARKMLGWSVADLVSRSGVGRNAIASFEDEGCRPDGSLSIRSWPPWREPPSSFPQAK